MLRLVSLLYALQFHYTSINIMETTWLKFEGGVRLSESSAGNPGTSAPILHHIHSIVNSK